ncbi:uncharacterized protein BKA78DRAFT_310388 [Phyllosticta capitalensis]|uniref:uncharacterized protein n=1 Tax=Phyllosticta capitalensis TaxID=121624 RepID=UPI00312D42AC
MSWRETGKPFPPGQALVPFDSGNWRHQKLGPRDLQVVNVKRVDERKSRDANPRGSISSRLAGKWAAPTHH